MTQQPLTNIMIARLAFRLAGRDYYPCDRVDLDSVPNVTRELKGHYERQRKVIPLTRQNYQDTLRSRPADRGDVGRGFTRTLLVEMDILDGAAPTEADEAKTWSPPANATAHKGRFVIEKKRGRGHFYDAVSASGELLRPQEFKTLDEAKAFIDQLPEPSTTDGASATSGTEAEPGAGHLEEHDENDGDLSTGSLDADQSGAADDRGHEGEPGDGGDGGGRNDHGLPEPETV